MNDNTGVIVITAILGVLLALTIAAGVYDHHHPLRCTDQATIKTILSIDYRSATIQLDDDREIVVHNVALKPGDKYCMAYSR